MKMHRKMMAALAVLALLSAAGCGKKADIVPADAVIQLAGSLTFTDQMTSMDSADTCRFYDVDTALIQDSAAYVGSGATAESLAVFQATDAEAAAAIVDALEAFTGSWLKGYADYKPEEVPKLESAVLKQDGVYVVYCVTAAGDTAKAAVDDLLNP